jgi:two-component system chemotaxis response regulator CheY
MLATVLLVEDSRYLRMVMRRILTEAGYTVIQAGDGEEGVRLVRETHPDLIILDLLLPVLGGERVLETLRKEEPTARTPVIVLSSLSQSNAPKLKEAGATAYIEKSRLDLTGSGENLIRIVHAALHEARPLGAAAAAHA